VASWGETHPPEPLLTAVDCWALRMGRRHHSVAKSVACRHNRAAGEHECVPILANGETVGLIQVAGRAAGGSLVDAVAGRIALSLANFELRETLRAQAIRDALTGLYNRRHVDEFFDREIRRAARRKRTIGAILIDVDHFKRLNDHHGHAAGDAALAAIGRLLGASVRGDDLACRYGGEELLVILPECGITDVAKRAEELRAAIKAMRVVHQGVELPAITVSMGVASFPEHGR